MEEFPEAIEEAQDAQQSLNDMLPADIGRYADKWVALRNGNVVASGKDVTDVTSSPDYEPTDILYPVPPLGPNFYLHRQVEGGIEAFADVLKPDTSTPEQGEERVPSPEAARRYARFVQSILDSQQAALEEADEDLLAA